MTRASSKTKGTETPLMQQFWRLKEESESCLLLFRMGDFYELFGDDAIVAAKTLEITLTSRDKNKENPMPMAGVPHHSVASYIQRLLDAGFKVAIAEQMQDPAAAKGIVEREIVRMFTPAIQFEQTSAQNTFLAALVCSSATHTSTHAGTQYSVALLDAATGESQLQQDMDGPTALNILARPNVRQILVQPRKNSDDDSNLRELKKQANSNRQQIETLSENFMPETAISPELDTAFGGAKFSFDQWGKSGTLALAIAVKYVRRSQRKDQLDYLQLPQPILQPQSLSFGPRSAEHLDLFPSSSGTPNLFDHINQTKSSLGGRQLRKWMEHPLAELSQIEERRNAVKGLHTAPLPEFRKCLAEVYDIERIMGRIGTGLANPRDIRSLGKTLALLPRLKGLLEILPSSKEGRLKELHQEVAAAGNTLGATTNSILKEFKEDAPLHNRDGNIFEKGTDKDLDRLIGLSQNGDKFLIDLEARERKATGISNLRVKYNRVFGYFIEISKAHLKKVPEHYHRKQSMVNAERFVTEELKSFEEEILSSKSKKIALEQELFTKWIKRLAAEAKSIQSAARLIGELDALCSLNDISRQPGWTFPVLDENRGLTLIQSRHPLVEEALGGEFVPNDLKLDFESRRTLLITGPNMGGKSTVMRQTALIVILGQIGCAVPAREASWGVFNALYTRIGAQDSIATGQSTFMVEMNELAHILSRADDRSLVILDEVGRGTSTFDGMSVAWAALEYLSQNLRSRTLFATHYHELTELGEDLKGLGNVHMGVEENDNGGKKNLRFLYELQEGPSNESYGIQVAELAGVPREVVQRAWQRLSQLESEQKPTVDDSTAGQLSFFASAAVTAPESTEKKEDLLAAIVPQPMKLELPPWTKELSELDLGSVTPIQALNFLHAWQNQSTEMNEGQSHG